MKIEEAINQFKFESEMHKLMLNLMYTSDWLEEPIRKMLAKYKLTLPQYNILRILKGSHPKPKAPNDIKAVMLHKKTDLTRMLDRLETKGLICREICSSNRRKMDVNITEEGLSILGEIAPRLKNASVDRMDNSISESEAKKLNLLLDKMRE